MPENSFFSDRNKSILMAILIHQRALPAKIQYTIFKHYKIHIKPNGGGGYFVLKSQHCMNHKKNCFLIENLAD